MDLSKDNLGDLVQAIVDGDSFELDTYQVNSDCNIEAKSTKITVDGDGDITIDQEFDEESILKEYDVEDIISVYNVEKLLDIIGTQTVIAWLQDEFGYTVKK